VALRAHRHAGRPGVAGGERRRRPGHSGSGDVRAGIAEGLSAGRERAAQAACWGPFAHSISGQRLAPQFGRTGFPARELVDEIAYTIATV
jgi:ADP-dependent NAD(P)H-hydrate dehydratase